MWPSVSPVSERTLNQASVCNVMMDGSNAWLAALISGTAGWWRPVPAGQVRAPPEPEGHSRSPAHTFRFGMGSERDS